VTANTLQALLGTVDSLRVFETMPCQLAKEGYIKEQLMGDSYLTRTSPLVNENIGNSTARDQPRTAGGPAIWSNPCRTQLFRIPLSNSQTVIKIIP